MSTRLREFRKLRSMTLQQLAQKVGTTAQTIQRLETDNMTVSLDWLHRIATVFGVPAAALIVTESTASVPVFGEVDAAGEVALFHAEAPVQTLSLVLAAPSPIAVRVAAPLASFETGTMLIGDKVEFDPDYLIEGRDCLVGFKTGRIVFRHVTSGAEGVLLITPPERMAQPGVRATAHRHVAPLKRSRDRDDPLDMAWIAPLLMAVRYF